MRSDPKIRAFEICLQKIQAGASLEQVLGLYPYWVEELRPRLEAAQAARGHGAAIQVPQPAQARSRDDFLQASQRGLQRHRRSRTVYPGRFRFVALALVLVLLLGAISAVAASGTALPGEPLYTVKIAIERARLLFTDSPSQRLELQTAYDRERLKEVEILVQSTRSTDNAAQAARPFPLEITFAGGLSEIRPGEWQVGGLRVRVPSNAQVVGQIKTGIFVDVQGDLQSDGTLVAKRIQAREFEITGKLQNRLGNDWVIGGVEVLVTPETIIKGEPEIGSSLLVKAFLLLDGDLFARLVEVVESDA